MAVNPKNPIIDQQTRRCAIEYGVWWKPSNSTLVGFVKALSDAFSSSTPFYMTSAQAIARGELKIGCERSPDVVKRRVIAYNKIISEKEATLKDATTAKANLAKTKTELEGSKRTISEYNERATKFLAEYEAFANDTKEKTEKMNAFAKTFTEEQHKLTSENVVVPYDDLSRQVMELTALVDAIDETVRMLYGCVGSDPDKVLRKVKELSTQKYMAIHTLEKIKALG